MNAQQKKQALDNALVSYAFPKKYFLHPVNKGSNIKFVLASESETGGIHTHSGAMNYDECNFYLKGWYDAKMNKFK